MSFNNYTIIKKIGEGAQGVVYLAKDKRLGRKVAIKSLHNNLITNKTQKERFIGEAKLLAQLAMVVTTMIWGITFVMVKDAYVSGLHINFQLQLKSLEKIIFFKIPRGIVERIVAP